MAGADGLVEPFRSNVLALITEAQYVHGTRVVIVSGFRTRAQQLALRKSNGCPDVLRSPARDCRIPTAIPGTSHHETGRAVDLGPSAALPLVAKLAPRFHLFAPVPGEPWHYEAAGAGDQSPAGAGTPSDPASSRTAPTGLGAVAHLFGLLISPAFWLRVVAVIAGALLVVAALAILGVDLTTPAA